MRKATITTAIAAIQKKFCGLAEIINIDNENCIDIIFRDLHSGIYYEVFSNTARTKLSITKANLK